jgi:Spy/CpxP family protein refolding chaperone
MNKKTNAMIRTGLALTVLLVPILASAQSSGEKQERQVRPRARMLARDLFDLTPEQEAKIEEFRKARAEENKAFRDQMDKIREERRELAKDPKADESGTAALIDRAYKLRAEQAKKALKNRSEWEKIYTAEQLERMKRYRGAFSARARRPGPARLRSVRPGMGRMMGPRIRGFARVGSRGRFGLGFRAPLRWRR